MNGTDVSLPATLIGFCWPCAPSSQELRLPDVGTQFLGEKEHYQGQQKPRYVTGAGELIGKATVVRCQLVLWCENVFVLLNNARV